MGMQNQDNKMSTEGARFLPSLIRKVGMTLQGCTSSAKSARSNTSSCQTLGGVYVEIDHRYHDDLLIEHDCLEISISTNISDASTSCSSMSSGHTEDSSWSASDSDHYQLSPSPLVARSIMREQLQITAPIESEADRQWERKDEEEVLNHIVRKSYQLPRSHLAQLASNHVVVNNERTKHRAAPLFRNPSLDSLAREHAQAMAADSCLWHRDCAELLDELAVEPPTDSDDVCRLGANVARGKDMTEMHGWMMSSPSDRNNMLDRRYTSMGVGTCKGRDGNMYICQLFSS